MKGTRAGASHASIHWTGSGTVGGEAMVLESTTHGTGITHPGVWDLKSEIVRSYKLLDDHEEAGRKALGTIWTRLGTDYDYPGVIRFGLRMIARWIFGLRLKAADTSETLFCSELVARWLTELAKQTGKGPTQISPADTPPADLIPILESMGCFECASS